MKFIYVIILIQHERKQKQRSMPLKLCEFTCVSYLSQGIKSDLCLRKYRCVSVCSGVCMYLSVFGVTPVTSQEEWSSVVNQLPRPSISITAAPEQRSRVKRTSCREHTNNDMLYRANDIREGKCINKPPYFSALLWVHLLMMSSALSPLVLQWELPLWLAFLSLAHITRLLPAISPVNAQTNKKTRLHILNLLIRAIGAFTSKKEGG